MVDRFRNRGKDDDEQGREEPWRSRASGDRNAGPGGSRSPLGGTGSSGRKPEDKKSNDESGEKRGGRFGNPFGNRNRDSKKPPSASGSGGRSPFSQGGDSGRRNDPKANKDDKGGRSRFGLPLGGGGKDDGGEKRAEPTGRFPLGRSASKGKSRGKPDDGKKGGLSRFVPGGRGGGKDDDKDKKDEKRSPFVGGGSRDSRSQGTSPRDSKSRTGGPFGDRGRGSSGGSSGPGGSSSGSSLGGRDRSPGGASGPGSSSPFAGRDRGSGPGGPSSGSSLGGRDRSPGGASGPGSSSPFAGRDRSSGPGGPSSGSSLGGRDRSPGGASGPGSSSPFAGRDRSSGPGGPSSGSSLGGRDRSPGGAPGSSRPGDRPGASRAPLSGDRPGDSGTPSRRSSQFGRSGPDADKGREPGGFGRRSPTTDSPPDRVPSRGKSQQSPSRTASSSRKSRSRTAEPPRSRAKSTARPIKTSKKQQRQGPSVVNHGLDFDRKLDLIGVALLGLALVVFFSVLPSMSFGIFPPAEGGLAGTIDRLLSQLFGWGKIALPVASFAIGLWLMVEYFGGEMFDVEYFRVVGTLVLYACVLTWVQFVEMVDDPAPTVDAFREMSRAVAIDEGHGGGFFGHQFYLFLLAQLGDFGAVSVMIAWLIVGLMLTFDATVAEIWQFVSRLFGFVSVDREGRAMRRKARIASEAETVVPSRPGAATAQPRQIALEAAAATGAGAAGVLGAADSSESRPDPVINRRGRSASRGAAPSRTTGAAEGAASEIAKDAASTSSAKGAGAIVSAPGTVAQQATGEEQGAESGGRMRSLFGRSSKSGETADASGGAAKSTATPVKGEDKLDSTSDDGAERGRLGLLGGLRRARSGSKQVEESKPASTVAQSSPAASGKESLQVEEGPSGGRLGGLFRRRSGDDEAGSSSETVAQPSEKEVGSLQSEAQPSRRPERVPRVMDDAAANDGPIDGHGKSTESPDRSRRTGIAGAVLGAAAAHALAGAGGDDKARGDARSEIDAKIDAKSDLTDAPHEKAPDGGASMPRRPFGARDPLSVPGSRSEKASEFDGKPDSDAADTPGSPLRVPFATRGDAPEAGTQPPTGPRRFERVPGRDIPLGSRRLGGSSVPDSSDVAGSTAGPDEATPESARGSEPSDRPDRMAARPERSMPGVAPGRRSFVDESADAANAPVVPDGVGSKDVPPLGVPAREKAGAARDAAPVNRQTGSDQAQDHVQDQDRVKDQERAKATEKGSVLADSMRTEAENLGMNASAREARAVPQGLPRRERLDPLSRRAQDDSPDIPSDASSGSASSASEITPDVKSEISVANNERVVGEASASVNSAANDASPDVAGDDRHYESFDDVALPVDVAGHPVDIPHSRGVSPLRLAAMRREREEREAALKAAAEKQTAKPVTPVPSAKPDDRDEQVTTPAEPVQGDMEAILPDTQATTPAEQPTERAPAVERSSSRPLPGATPIKDGTLPPAGITPAQTAPPVRPAAGQPLGASARPQDAPARNAHERPRNSTAGTTPNAPKDSVLRTRPKPPEWVKPRLSDLLQKRPEQDVDDALLLDKARVIEDTLGSFGAPGKVVEVNPGPVITQFGVEPDYLTNRSGKRTRVKVGTIARLDADLALALAAKSIRIEAPVPGKGFVGIEVPNDNTTLVGLYDIMDGPEFRDIDSKLRLALGLSVDGTPVAADLTQMPHLLIAGTTGSGKSVCVNTIISSLLLANSPDEVQFIMVDPKRVELTGYNGVPHLVAPVVVDLERIVGVLQWVQREMEERYRKFAAIGARNIVDFNRKLEEGAKQMPYYVVVIDELADLMMLAPDETERLLARLAQMARATGIHLIISTQRPSVDIITGLIKANFPARIAFAVASMTDSRVILDQPGAEKLLGRGDMLFLSPDAAAPLRMQGVYVSDEEINKITGFWKRQVLQQSPQAQAATMAHDVSFTVAPMDGGRDSGSLPMRNPSQPSQATLWDAGSSSVSDDNSDGKDELYGEALDLVQRLNKASISLLQRRLRIGYTRAARLIDIMEEEGIVGPAESGSKPRDVLNRGPYGKTSPEQESASGD